MTCTVQKNNVGTIFRLTFQDCAGSLIDISTATTKEIKFKKPSGTTATKAGTFTTDGSNGKLEYTSESGLLDEITTWQIQGHVIIGTQDFNTTIGTFEVVENL